MENLILNLFIDIWKFLKINLKKKLFNLNKNYLRFNKKLNLKTLK